MDFDLLSWFRKFELGRRKVVDQPKSGEVG